MFAHTSDPSKLGSGGVTVVLDPQSNMLMTIIGNGNDQPAIKYVPMSRWVHIVAVYSNGTLTYFMDGEVHSVHSLSSATVTTFIGPSGNLTISGGAQATGNTYSSFQGYVGYLTFINFYPSPGLIKRLYAMGPTPSTSVLNVFGMVGYGVRSPIYQLNNAAPTGN